MEHWALVGFLDSHNIFDSAFFLLQLLRSVMATQPSILLYSPKTARLPYFWGPCLSVTSLILRILNASYILAPQNAILG